MHEIPSLETVSEALYSVVSLYFIFVEDIYVLVQVFYDIFKLTPACFILSNVMSSVTKNIEWLLERIILKPEDLITIVLHTIMLL